jgi:hypothetical protein
MLRQVGGQRNCSLASVAIGGDPTGDGRTKESMSPRQTEQETANQSVAGEEDPLAGVDQEGHGTSRQRQRG